MKLPDFLEFEPFNQLRQAMGAEQLGQFEFFDPRLHLTADERDRLSRGYDLGWSALRCLHDYTLAYKNSRVLLWVDEPGQSWAVPCYHLAYCRKLRWLRGERPHQQVSIATRLPPPDPWPWQVCSECLQQLQFRGYDAARGRHKDFSERVREEFELDDFLEHYPQYPVKTDWLRALDSVTDV